MKPTRRDFLKTCAAGAAALLAGGALAAPAAKAAERPNVIVIFADDLGNADLGCQGATDIKTPALDALAARGTRFTQFYAAAALCSPSRAALMSGRYPLRVGLTGNAPSQRGQKGGLPAAEVTMAETFKAAGYATAHIGKWHLGYTPGQMPNDQGFDYSFGHMGGCIDNWSHFFYWQGPNVHDLHRNGKEVFEEGRFFPDLMVEEATGFLKKHQSGPFLMYFAINLPHYPYQPGEGLREEYQGLPYPRNLYGAFVAAMDQRIGALLKAVDELGLREKTIVVFQSDNGHSTEERAHFGGGSAGRYRGAKGSLFEGGIRMPAIISWPGRIPAGAVRGQLAHGCDWLPTVAELAGVPLIEKSIDGKSIAGVIRSGDAPTPHETLHWQMGPGKNAQWAVRQGDWKLIGNAQDTSQGGGAKRFPLWLSNLAENPEETRNYAAEQPEVVKRLRQLHDEWWERNHPRVEPPPAANPKKD